MNKILLLN